MTSGKAKCLKPNLVLVQGFNHSQQSLIGKNVRSLASYLLLLFFLLILVITKALQPVTLRPDSASYLQVSHLLLTGARISSHRPTIPNTFCALASCHSPFSVMFWLPSCLSGIQLNCLALALHCSTSGQGFQAVGLIHLNEQYIAIYL